MALGISLQGGVASPVTARVRDFDATTALTVYLVLLLALPSALIVTPLGGLGRPSILWGLGCLVWWVWTRLERTTHVDRPRQLVLLAMTAFLVVALLSYAAAQVRGLPWTETSPADTGLLRLASWTGIVLVASDGITRYDRFITLLRRLTVAGALVATLGLLQFATRQSFLVDLGIPGLAIDTSLLGPQARGMFTRASGTASHPLEYAVVLSAVLPLALTFAIEGLGRHRLRRWALALVPAVACLLSVSRSAILGFLAGLLVMVPSWPHRVRAATAAVGAALLGAIYLLVPGMIGTLTGMFMGVGYDSSTVSRTSSYDTALEIAQRFAVIGRGFGTFLPQYRILDNQFLQLVIELGVLGLAALLALVAAACFSAYSMRRLSVSSLDRQIGQSLVAGLIATTVLLAFFDAFSFPQAPGMLFLLVGLAGAGRNVALLRSGGHSSG